MSKPKRNSTDRLNKKVGTPSEGLTVESLIRRLQELPGELPVFCGNLQAAIGLEVREGRLGTDYYGSRFSPLTGGRHRGVFLTAWSEDVTGEVHPCIYTGT